MVEEDIIERYWTDKIQSPVHLSIGQEAVAVGLCHNLASEDLLFSTYRSHAFYLAKGGDLNRMMAELYGRSDGCCQGKGGSMHLAAPEVGFVGTSAVVGSSISNAVGAALAAKTLNKTNLTIAVFGDGATEEGVFHESLNFASLHQLPVVFVCENNQYAVHSELAARQSYKLEQLVGSYSIPYAKLDDACDPQRVSEQFSPLIELVRNERKPIFIEVPTYRYKEHVGPGDDFQAGYRSEQTLHEWKDRDCLIQDSDAVARYSAAIRSEILESVEFAEKSPAPGIEQLYRDVF